MRSSLHTWLTLVASALAAFATVGGCSFPEHEFIPPGEFEKLKNGNLGGSGFDGGNTGGFGAFGGADSGSGGSGLTGGVGGATGGTGGATGGTGGVGGGTGGAPSCAGRCGQPGPVPGSNPACYCDSSCQGFSNCCSDYATVCGADAGTGGATGGTGGASGGAGGASGGTGGASGGSGGATGGTGGAGCKTIVVNEVATTGPGGGFDEFVELYNYGSCTASLAGWKVKYSSSSGATQVDKWIGAGGDTLAAGAYWVIGGNNYTGAKNATLINPSSGLADKSGIGLFNPGAAKVDSVGYGGVSPSHPFVETSAFSQTGTATKSVGRSPNGADTNNNSADFMRVNRSPGAAN